MNREIKTVFQRAEINRAGKGVVNNGIKSVFPGKFHYGLQVGDLHERIGYALHVDSFSI